VNKPQTTTVASVITEPSAVLAESNQSVTVDSGPWLARPVQRLTLYVALTAIVVWSGTGVWAAFHGFDPFDEAWYVITYRDARASDPLATIAPFVIRPLFDLLGGSVVGLRLVKLTAWLVLGTFFGSSSAMWINTTPGLRRVSPPLVGAIFTTSTMVVYAVYPPTPSYNDLAVGSVLLLVALALRACVLAADDRRGIAIIAGAVGVVLTVLGLNKATTGVIMALAVAVILLSGSRECPAWKSHWRVATGVVLATGALTLVTIHVLIVDVFEFLEASRWTASTVEQTTNVWSALRDRETRTLRRHWQYIREDFGVVGVPVMATVLAGWRKWQRTALTMVLLSAAAFATVVIDGGYQVGGYRALSTQSVAITVLLIGALCLLSTRVGRPGGPPARLAVLFALLTVLPMMQAIGSTVPYIYLAVSAAPLWLLVAVVAAVAQPAGLRRLLGLLSLAGIWVLAMTVAWTGLVSSPTRVWTPLWDQTVPAPTRELRGIRIDRRSADHFRAVSSAIDANWHVDGDPLVIGLTDLPGAIVYTEAETIAGGWFFSLFPGRNVRVLQRACTRPEWHARGGDPLILVRDFTLLDEYVDVLKACGVNFPEGYLAVEVFEQPVGYYPYSPRLTLWAPVTGSNS
jgi:hypothetical protein